MIPPDGEVGPMIDTHPEGELHLFALPTMTASGMMPSARCHGSVNLLDCLIQSSSTQVLTRFLRCATLRD